MTRLGAFVATCALGLLGVAHIAHADPRADQLAKEGSDAMFREPPQYDVAIEKFRQAIVLSPEGTFYLKLCVAYYQIGEFGLALQSCDAVQTAGGDAKTMANTKKVTAEVEAKIRELGKDPNDIRNPPPPDTGGGDTGTGGGDTGTGGGDTGTGTGGGDTGTGGGDTGGGGGGDIGGGGGGAGPVDTTQFRGQPQPSLYQAKPASHDYTWSVGGEIYALGSNVGNSGETYYGSAGAGFRLHADYIIGPARRIGLQGFLGFGSIGSDDDTVTGETLSIVDIGAAAYAHLYCAGRMCVTPLVGVSISGMQPESTGEQVSYAAFGLRLEGAVSYAIGTKFEHVISAQLGANLYTGAFGEFEDMTVEDANLDDPSRTIYFGLGYTHRFDTPFGQAPFITLQ